MKNYLNTVRFQSERNISGEYENHVLRELNQLKGIERLHLGLDFVEVDYYPQFLTPGLLREALTKASFDFKELPATRTRGIFKGLISNLANENRKAFGSKGPSCCG